MALEKTGDEWVGVQKYSSCGLKIVCFKGCSKPYRIGQRHACIISNYVEATRVSRPIRVSLAKYVCAVYKAFLFSTRNTTCGRCEPRGLSVADLNKDQMRRVVHDQIDFSQPREKVARYQSEPLFSEKCFGSPLPIIAHAMHVASTGDGGTLRVARHSGAGRHQKLPVPRLSRSARSLFGAAVRFRRE